MFGLLQAATHLGQSTLEFLGPFEIVAAHLRTHGIEDGVGDARLERRDLVSETLEIAHVVAMTSSSPLAYR